MKRTLFFLVFFSIASLGYAEPLKLPFQKGETIQYKIKQLAATAGHATLTFEGLAKLADGREALLIIFKATALNFLDEEKIYVDPTTFLPVVVERDLNIFGKKEKIAETYLPQEKKIKITKTAGGKTTEQMIEKEGAVANIYGFIYRYRAQGTFQKGEKLNLNLPTQNVAINLLDDKKVKAAGRVFETSFMKSADGKYQIWFDKSAQRIPLRISGAVGLANTMMVMTEYTPGKE